MAVEVGILLFSLILASIVIYLVWTSKFSQPNTEVKKTSSSDSKKNAKKPVKTSSKASKIKPAAPSKDSKSPYTHSWLLTTLKGHTGIITDLDISPNGKYLATSSEDRSLMLWGLKLGKLESSITELNMKDIRTIRTHVQYDHANRLRWSPDSKALLTVRALSNEIEIFKLGKKPEAGLPSLQATHTLPKIREDALIAIEVASTGQYIMTCTAKNEVDIVSLNGNVLTSFVNNQVETYFAKISPDAKLVGTSGFTPEVKLWQVCYSKSGSFERTTRAFELTGHTSGVLSFDFSPDSRRMVTVSKDGTWRLYNTDIEFSKGQLATVLTTGKWTNGHQPAHVALSPDLNVVAIGTDSSIYIYSTSSGELLSELKGVHNAPIRCIRFDPTSRFLLSTGDKYVRVFHNVPGFKVSISQLTAKLREASGQALKERIQLQIKEAQTMVNLFE